ncbi:MAG: membrane protein insertase YidC [Fimbriimonadales bacterium]
MAQQPEIDQKKLFTQTLIISMVIWLVFIMGWSYFSRPPVSDKPAEEVVQEIEKLRVEKDYAEALRRAQELTTRFGGTENGALGLLLEAKIFYEDKQDAREAYNRLRKLEEFYPHTKIYQEQGKPLIEQVCAEIDEQNRTLTTYRFIDTLVGLLGRNNASYILAIFLIALGVRLILFPLTNKQFASMRKMLQVAPKLQELQQKYTGQELMQRQMALYKKYGINPMSGCLFALIPIPFLILMYNMFLVYQVQFRNAEFLWMNSTVGARFPGFLAGNLAQFDVILTALYALSMYLTSRLTITDPSQAQMQKTMALFTTAMLAIFSWQFRFPAAFILYWMLTNVFYTAHYKWYMSKPAPELVPVDDTVEVETNGKAQPKRVYQPPKKRSKKK